MTVVTTGYYRPPAISFVRVENASLLGELYTLQVVTKMKNRVTVPAALGPLTKIKIILVFGCVKCSTLAKSLRIKTVELNRRHRPPLIYTLCVENVQVLAYLCMFKDIQFLE